MAMATAGSNKAARLLANTHPVENKGVAIRTYLVRLRYTVVRECPLGAALSYRNPPH